MFFYRRRRQFLGGIGWHFVFELHQGRNTRQKWFTRWVKMTLTGIRYPKTIGIAEFLTETSKSLSINVAPSSYTTQSVKKITNTKTHFIFIFFSKAFDEDCFDPKNFSFKPFPLVESRPSSPAELCILFVRIWTQSNDVHRFHRTNVYDFFCISLFFGYITLKKVSKGCIGIIHDGGGGGLGTEGRHSCCLLDWILFLKLTFDAFIEVIYSKI